MTRSRLVKLFALLLVALLGAASATADDAKLSKKERKAVEKILKGKQERVKLPGMLFNDEAAMSFCYGVGKYTDAEYTSMMADCKARVDENALLLKYNGQMSDKDREKYGEENVYKVMKSAAEENRRFEILSEYCDREREIIAAANARKMPKGKIVRVDYTEGGSSRPTPIRIHMALGTDSHMHLIFNNQQFQDEKPVTVPEDVQEQLRTTFEENKLYKLHSFYGRPYGFPTIIEPLGGPPSCMFAVEFEDGTVISSRTDRQYFSEDCQDFVGILRGYYWNKRKNDDNKVVLIK